MQKSKKCKISTKFKNCKDAKVHKMQKVRKMEKKRQISNAMQKNK
jgi:hypothetical protein